MESKMTECVGASPESESPLWPDAIEWYERAKEHLHEAYGRGAGIPNAAAEFLRARAAVRDVFEAIWPG